MTGENKNQGDNSFVIQGITTTPRRDEVERVSTEASNEALKRLQESTTLTEYFRWHQSLPIFTINNLDWMWDYGGVTANDVIEERESDRISRLCEKRASAAESMKQKIDELEPQDGMLRVALKRIRESGKSSYRYATLASFPEGTQASDVLDLKMDKNSSNNEIDIVYFEPTTACVNHACDDLFKTNRDNAFYIPYKDVYTATALLNGKQNETAEYLIKNNGEETLKQDTQNYLLVALHGGFSNEFVRTRVSDFWNKQQTKN